MLFVRKESHPWPVRATRSPQYKVTQFAVRASELSLAPLASADPQACLQSTQPKGHAATNARIRPVQPTPYCHRISRSPVQPDSERGKCSGLICSGSFGRFHNPVFTWKKMWSRILRGVRNSNTRERMLVLQTGIWAQLKEQIPGGSELNVARRRAAAADSLEQKHES